MEWYNKGFIMETLLHAVQACKKPSKTIGQLFRRERVTDVQGYFWIHKLLLLLYIIPSIKKELGRMLFEYHINNRKVINKNITEQISAREFQSTTSPVRCHMRGTFSSVCRALCVTCNVPYHKKRFTRSPIDNHRILSHRFETWIIKN